MTIEDKKKADDFIKHYKLLAHDVGGISPNVRNQLCKWFLENFNNDEILEIRQYIERSGVTTV